MLGSNALPPNVMRRLLFTFLALGFPSWASDPLEITKDNVRSCYRTFSRLTEKPCYVAPLTALLCRPPDKAVLDRELALTGPHTRVAVHFYANPSALGAIVAKVKVFPPRSVIVKEKLSSQKTVSEVAGMIKREAGYDPRNGDWEFFFDAADGTFSTGKLTNCIECHRRADRDHVYRLWDLPATKREVK